MCSSDFIESLLLFTINLRNENENENENEKQIVCSRSIRLPSVFVNRCQKISMRTTVEFSLFIQFEYLSSMFLFHSSVDFLLSNDKSVDVDSKDLIVLLNLTFFSSFFHRFDIVLKIENERKENRRR